MVRRTAARLAILAFIAAISLAASSCGRRAPSESAAKQETPLDPNGVNKPLQFFSQQITTKLKSLRVRPSEVLEVPVTVRNTGQEMISSRGKLPVTVSYKWYEAGKMLPMEGERTGLPKVLKPNEEVDVSVRVVAPPSGKPSLLKITLVQEGVEWFMTAGAAPLTLPVTTR